MRPFGRREKREPDVLERRYGWLIIDETHRFPIVDFELRGGMTIMYARIDGPYAKLKQGEYQYVVLGLDRIEVFRARVEAGWPKVPADEYVVLEIPRKIVGVVKSDTGAVF